VRQLRSGDHAPIIHRLHGERQVVPKRIVLSEGNTDMRVGNARARQ